MVLKIQRVGGETREFSNGHTVTFGTGDADIALTQYEGLAPRCAELWIEDKRTYLKNICDSGTALAHNGQPVFGKVVVWNGDRITAGRDKFVVVIRKTAQGANRKGSIAVSGESVAEAPSEFLTFAVNPAVASHIPTNSNWSHTTYLEKLHQSSDAFFFANFKHAGVAVPDWVTSDDLFQPFPQEVQDVYSLHPVRSESFAQMMDTFNELQEADAAVWVVPKSTVDAAVDDAKFHLAWFARPSVLAQALSESAKEFGEALLEPFKAICLKGVAGTADWVVISKSGQTISDLGLSPTSQQ